MKDDISKTIYFKFSNKFTKQFVLIVEMPYLPFKATCGYYSNLFRELKDNCAFGFDKKLIVGKHWFEKKRTKRTLFMFPNNITLDIPYDVTNKDVKIINYYLEGLKMSLK